ncbi:MAG: hypothetical protein KC609_00650 [Myxococcales bacterium]|nr:hypothetical protein [Myxococcales bacterium]
MLALIANTSLSFERIAHKLQPVLTLSRAQQGEGFVIAEFEARALEATAVLHRFDDIEDLGCLFVEGEEAADFALLLATAISLWPMRLLHDYRAMAADDDELHDALMRVSTAAMSHGEPAGGERIVGTRREPLRIATRILGSLDQQLARFAAPFSVTELEAADGLRLVRLQRGPDPRTVARYLSSEADYLGCLYFQSEYPSQSTELALACAGAIRYLPEELLPHVVREATTGSNRLTGMLALALQSAETPEAGDETASQRLFDEMLTRYEEADEMHRQIASRARALQQRASRLLASNDTRRAG